MNFLVLVICLLHLNQFRVTTSSTGCKDISTSCSYHLQNCQTSSDVRYYCRKSCGLCGCRDRRSDCLRYTKFCKSNRDVQYYCQKSCGLCGITTHSPTITKLACRDKSTLCRHLIQDCKTNTNVKRDCQKSCGLCGITTRTPTATKPGTKTKTRTVKRATTNQLTTPKYTTPKYTTTTKALCGVSSIKNARIINGNISKPGEWPWQVALLRDGVFICGGVLISPTWVLTAAQCIDRISVSSIKVVLGEHDREKASGNEQIISAEHFKTHERYNNPTNLNNDIALIRLSIPARLNKYVKPICLPLQGTTPGKAGRCYLSGWGKSTQPGQYVKRLHHGKLSIVEYDKCKKSNSKYVPITPQMLCATGENMASGCYGDNGGPFVCQAADGRWTLHGVFSWGSPRCSVSDAYSVFARVSAFRQWIGRFV